MTHITAGGKSWVFNNFLFSQALWKSSLYYEGAKKNKIAVLCIYKKHRINRQHNRQVRRLCAESQFKGSTSTLIQTQHITLLTSPFVSRGFKCWDLSERKYLLPAPVIAFPKTKNSFKNICQELELNDFFLHSAQIKMTFNVIKTPLIPCISMHDFKAIFKVMNKHYKQRQECRLGTVAISLYSSLTLCENVK